MYEKQRNNVRIIKEKIADYIDPPRFYPSDRPRAIASCTLQVHDLLADERAIVGYPVPHTLEDREAIEVVYIDHNHFHMVGECRAIHDSESVSLAFTAGSNNDFGQALSMTPALNGWRFFLQSWLLRQ